MTNGILTNMTKLYLQDQIDIQGREAIRKYGIQDRAPLIGQICQACDKPFEVGQDYAMVAPGPGADVEERAKCRSGRVYNAVAVVAHYECVAGAYP